VAQTEEGCLSVPQVYEKVERAERVRVRAQDRNGEFFERDLEGLLAVCVQHEMDHLDGRLFVDYLSSLKRERIRRKLVKEQRERGAAPRSRAPPEHAAAKVI
jgi:peptide deformylase